MSLLEQIQTDAADAKSELGSLLQKCQVLAARLKCQPLEQWLVREAYGYQVGVVVPEYRMWEVEVRGNFYGVEGDALRSAPVPAPLIPDDVRDAVTRYRCRQGIGGIEATLAACDSGVLQVPVAELALLLEGNVYAHHVCAQAWIEFCSDQLVAVLGTVRRRILDFALELRMQDPRADALNAAPSSSHVAKVNRIFNDTILRATPNIADSVPSMAFAVLQRNIDSLADVLQSAGVTDEDLAELTEALEAEPSRPTPQSFGPRVSSWIAKMVKKASIGQWNIGIGTAGQLSEDAIGQYYGAPRCQPTHHS